MISILVVWKLIEICQREQRIHFMPGKHSLYHDPDRLYSMFLTVSPSHLKRYSNGRLIKKLMVEGQASHILHEEESIEGEVLRKDCVGRS